MVSDGIQTLQPGFQTAGYITSATNGQLLWCPSTNNCTGAYYRAQDLEAGTVADFFTWQDQNSIGGEGNLLE